MVSKKKILYWLGVVFSTFFVVLGLIFDNFFSEIVLILSENMGKVVSLGVTAGVMLLGKMMGSVLQRFDAGEVKASRYLGVVMDAFERMGERNDENIRKTNEKIDRLIEDSVAAKDEIKDFRERLLKLEK